MYGKHFESMYEGSMYGAGLAVFAVWGYVIAYTRDSRIELNPRKLADTLGGTVEEIKQAIETLMNEDPESRHKEEGGRRLIKEGEFQYRVPSWEYYQGIKNEQARREYNREAQRKHRSNKGLTASEIVMRAVKNDPITKADKKHMKKFMVEKDTQCPL
jgi:hypothetical protein